MRPSFTTEARRTMQVSISPPGAEIADAAGVDAALVLFQFVDDLHGPDFRRAGDGPGGEARGERGDCIDAFTQFALDVGDDVHHVAVALDEETVGHLDRPDFRDAADVVTAKIEQHEMFGALLRIGQELGRERLVLARAFSPRPGACDRSDDNLALAHPHQDFRARANDLEAAEVEKAEVGGWVDPPQRAVKRKCWQVEAACEPLRQHNLERVAGGDIVLRTGDHRLVLVLGRIRPRFARLDERIDGHRGGVIERRFERVDHRVEPRHGALVSRAG